MSDCVSACCNIPFRSNRKAKRGEYIPLGFIQASADNNRLDCSLLLRLLIDLAQQGWATDGLLFWSLNNKIIDQPRETTGIIRGWRL